VLWDKIEAAEAEGTYKGYVEDDHGNKYRENPPVTFKTTKTIDNALEARLERGDQIGFGEIQEDQTKARGISELQETYDSIDQSEKTICALTGTGFGMATVGRIAMAGYHIFKNGKPSREEFKKRLFSKTMLCQLLLFICGLLAFIFGVVGNYNNFNDLGFGSHGPGYHIASLVLTGITFIGTCTHFHYDRLSESYVDQTKLVSDSGEQHVPDIHVSGESEVPVLRADSTGSTDDDSDQDSSNKCLSCGELIGDYHRCADRKNTSARRRLVSSSLQQQLVTELVNPDPPSNNKHRRRLLVLERLLAKA